MVRQTPHTAGPDKPLRGGPEWLKSVATASASTSPILSKLLEERGYKQHTISSHAPAALPAPSDLTTQAQRFGPRLFRRFEGIHSRPVVFSEFINELRRGTGIVKRKRVPGEGDLSRPVTLGLLVQSPEELLVLYLSRRRNVGSRFGSGKRTSVRIKVRLISPLACRQ